MKTIAEKACDLLRKVPKGRVTTYKEIAHALETRAYRASGRPCEKIHMPPKFPDTGLSPHPVGLGDFRGKHREPRYRTK